MSATQVDLQLVAPHTYGTQLLVVATVQVPRPSHTRVGVAVVPVHEAAVQTVEVPGYEPQVRRSEPLQAA